MSESEADEPRPALPLPSNSSSPSSQSSDAPPVTAEQYLRRVRRELDALPQTVVAETSPPPPPPPQTRSSLPISRIPPHPTLFPAPDEQWVQRLVEWFSTVQSAVALSRRQRNARNARKLPAVNDATSWKRILNDEKGPLLSIVLALDFLRVLKLFRIIDHELGAMPNFTCPLSEQRRGTASTLADRFLYQRRHQWLFCLMAVLQPPLSRDSAATLRSILQKAAFARHGMTGVDDKRLSHLNVLIAILGTYFGQGDAD
ncbi:Gem-associated protein 2 [Gracilariopsis chorda]|uniref:Gem-associated protein 2 n=1 Tax=Gracilariopsis chorda TaxID=448386 RepID=A0A2V3IKK1_9FLOR|nr:Gem-associated protein 2 [Gracilariopsis chorda]|eukprot:PXF41650.1 Gem-associated protein 2 [Gracilariopsis chorda]